MKKNIIITGGNGGIANAINRRLKSDYNILLPDRIKLDVTNVLSIKNYFHNKNIDILINNAGYIEPSNIIEDNDEFIQTFQTNTIGVFQCTKEVLKNNPHAIIINIGSSAGSSIKGGWSSYCSSKAAIIMATSCWAQEGISTICISPGRCATKMRNKLYPDEDQTTLLSSDNFARIIKKAINGHYKFTGLNIDVNLNNIEELLNEK